MKVIKSNTVRCRDVNLLGAVAVTVTVILVEKLATVDSVRASSTLTTPLAPPQNTLSPALADTCRHRMPPKRCQRSSIHEIRDTRKQRVDIQCSARREGQVIYL
jgi:hypothetical protein